ncbi:hypothetical protein Q604_UNBC05200G0001, partial [human gut metagenome]
LFAAEYATEVETAAEIKRVYRRLITLKLRTQRSLQLFIKNTGQLQVMRLRLLLLQPPVLTNSQLWQSKL